MKAGHTNYGGKKGTSLQEVENSTESRRGEGMEPMLVKPSSDIPRIGDTNSKLSLTGSRGDSLLLSGGLLLPGEILLCLEAAVVFGVNSCRAKGCALQARVQARKSPRSKGKYSHSSIVVNVMFFSGP